MLKKKKNTGALIKIIILLLLKIHIALLSGNVWSVIRIYCFNLFIPSFIFGRVSCSPDWQWTCSVAENDFEYITVLLLHPECWNYRHTRPAYAVLGWIQGIRVLGRPSSSWTQSPAPKGFTSAISEDHTRACQPACFCQHIDAAASVGTCASGKDTVFVLFTDHSGYLIKRYKIQNQTHS